MLESRLVNGGGKPDENPAPASSDVHEGLRLRVAHHVADDEGVWTVVQCDPSLLSADYEVVEVMPVAEHEDAQGLLRRLAVAQAETEAALKVERRRTEALIYGVMAQAVVELNIRSGAPWVATVGFKGINLVAGGDDRDGALAHLRQRLTEVVVSSLDAGEPEAIQIDPNESKRLDCESRNKETEDALSDIPAPASVEGEPERIAFACEKCGSAFCPPNECAVEGGGDGRPDRDDEIEKALATWYSDKHWSTSYTTGEADLMRETMGKVLDRFESAPVDREARIERAVRALTQHGQTAPRAVGDVMHDYDWTPREAAEAVVDALSGVEATGEGRTIVVDEDRDYAVQRAEDGGIIVRRLSDDGDGNDWTPLDELLKRASSGLPDEPSAPDRRVASCLNCGFILADRFEVSDAPGPFRNVETGVVPGHQECPHCAVVGSWRLDRVDAQPEPRTLTAMARDALIAAAEHLKGQADTSIAMETILGDAIAMLRGGVVLAQSEREDGPSEAECDLRSLRRELATLLGPIKPRAHVSENAQWIGAVGDVLRQRDAARETASRAGEAYDSLCKSLWEAVQGDLGSGVPAEIVEAVKWWRQRAEKAEREAADAVLDLNAANRRIERLRAAVPLSTETLRDPDTWRALAGPTGWPAEDVGTVLRKTADHLEPQPPPSQSEVCCQGDHPDCVLPGCGCSCHALSNVESRSPSPAGGDDPIPHRLWPAIYYRRNDGVCSVQPFAGGVQYVPSPAVGLTVAEKATDIAERYGEAIAAISGIVNGDGTVTQAARLNKIRTVIAGLAVSEVTDTEEGDDAARADQ